MGWPEYLRRGAIRLKRDGLPWLASAVLNRVFPARPRLGALARQTVENQSGLEIGGPSAVFGPRGILPLYRRAARLDNVNFAARTAWEKNLSEGGEFRFAAEKPAGRQLLREATALRGIADASYDFVLSSHCLEHVANPLAALHEWRRVTRSGGHLILLLPDPVHTFDCARPITTIEHLRADHAAGRSEDDLTHLEEIFALHDLGRDPQAGSREQFRARALRNAEVRCLHHHVFDLALLRTALAEGGWEVLATERVRPIHLVAVARRPAVVAAT